MSRQLSMYAVSTVCNSSRTSHSSTQFDHATSSQYVITRSCWLFPRYCVSFHNEDEESLIFVPHFFLILLIYHLKEVESTYDLRVHFFQKMDRLKNERKKMGGIRSPMTRRPTHTTKTRTKNDRGDKVLFLLHLCFEQGFFLFLSILSLFPETFEFEERVIEICKYVSFG